MSWHTTLYRIIPYHAIPYDGMRPLLRKQQTPTTLSTYITITTNESILGSLPMTLFTRPVSLDLQPAVIVK